VNKRAILIVEDSPTDEALLLRALKKIGVTNPVVVAKDGLEAIQYLFAAGRFEFRDANDLPAIVLVDLKLPKLDGLEVLNHLRAHEPTKFLPVVILTSSKEQRDVLNGYIHGANSYIVKPVDFEKFIEAVKKLGLYWLFLNESASY